MKIKCRELANLFVMMICAIVGVGFISGAEIYEFFVKFEGFCYVGIVLFFLLNFMLVYKILSNNDKYKNYIKVQKIDNNKSKNTFKHKKFIKSILIFINVLLMSAAMFSGIKILAINLLNNNYLIVMILCLIFVFLVLLFGIKGLAKVDYFVFIFVLVLTIFFVGSKEGIVLEYQTNINSSNWAFGGVFGQFASSIIFACLYVFMNIVQVEPLYKESGLTLSKKQSIAFSLIFSAFLTSVLIVFVTFLKSHTDLFSASMPFLQYFSNASGSIYILFIVGLFFAIITTLLSCLIGVKRGFLNLFKTRVVGFKAGKQSVINNKQVGNNEVKLKFNLKNFAATAVSVTITFILSFIGFNTYVSVIYPIIGVINFIIFIFL